MMMSTHELAKLDLLVVDHVASVRHLTAGLLRGLTVGNTRMASSGREALALMRLSRPTLVLAEWEMPEMDGLELLRAVRADPQLADVPVVLVMADMDRRLVEQAVASGVSDLLVKPYSLQRLEDKILAAVRRGAPPAARPKPAAAAAEAQSEPASQQPTLLVVDDTPDNLRLMAGLFGDEYRVKVADNGEKALAICNGDVTPDLVLLDVMMPGMDGFEVARRLRAQANGETIPVIFVTALTDERSQLRGLDLGAVDFVSKPVDPDVLRLRVRNFMRYVELHKRRQQEFDAILAESRRKHELAVRIREELAQPLREALEQLQGQAGQDLAAPLAQLNACVLTALDIAAASE
jgi:CheY-like chemotaxis protein